MRILTSIFLLMFVLFLSSSKFARPEKNSNEKLNGTWQPVKQEIGGKALPGTAFETQKLIINDSTYTVVAESVDKGLIKYSDGRMDIYGKNGVNAGKHFTAIFKIENEQLVICYDLSGNAYPVSFETKSNPLLFLSIFKKIQ